MLICNGLHSLPAPPSTQPLEKSNFCVFEITFLDFEIIFLDLSNADKLYLMDSIPCPHHLQRNPNLKFCYFDITFLDFDMVFLDVSNADKSYLMDSILWLHQSLVNFNAITFEMIFLGGDAARPLDATSSDLTHESVRMW